MQKLTRQERLEIATTRLKRILTAHKVCTARTLEQKISDAGPYNQRIDPHDTTGPVGIECKNVREWLYPDRSEIRDLIYKCCCLDAVPVLIARRWPYVTFSVLGTCGVILHQTYNQRLPSADSELAAKAKDKSLLGYHDIRLGNEPDSRLVRFVHTNLPGVLPTARERFEEYKDLLFDYGTGEKDYAEFAARVKRRMRGEPEDLPPFEEF